jgi:hypothetical protein
MKQDPKEMLAHLDDLEARRQLVIADYENARRRIIPVSIQQQLEDLELKHQEDMEEVEQSIKDAKDQMRPVALEYGKKLEGRYFQVQIRKGTDKWDSRGLEAWFAAHGLDALERFRTKGKPTVAFVEKKEK